MQYYYVCIFNKWNPLWKEQTNLTVLRYISEGKNELFMSKLRS